MGRQLFERTVGKTAFFGAAKTFALKTAKKTFGSAAFSQGRSGYGKQKYFYGWPKLVFTSQFQIPFVRKPEVSPLIL